MTRAAKITKERMYNIVRRPLITEKATLGSANGKVTFVVAVDANKNEIKAAVQQLFKVKVTKVNTLLRKGKVKRFKGKLGTRPTVKHAIVTLAEGETIDVSTGL